MLKCMIFIDIENFRITQQSYFTQIHKGCPKTDYEMFAKNLISTYFPDYYLSQTILFFPKPDDFLMNDEKRANRYLQLKSLAEHDYITTVQGRHVARPTKGHNYSDMDISKNQTYYVQEKGTDINLATHLLVKAYNNSYDIAIVVSGDTDYIPVYKTLKFLGKSVIVVGIHGQKLDPFKQWTDQQITLNSSFLKSCKKAVSDSNTQTEIADGVFLEEYEE